jgi:uncharacterized protein (TIGR02246 family)
MGRILFVALLLLSAFSSALSQTPGTRIEAKTQDEAAIRQLMKDVVVAWNMHDGVSYAMLFAKDADFTNWRGTVRLHGRDDISKMNASLATGMFRQSTLSLTATRIRFLSSEIAAIHCDWQLTGAIDYDGKGTIPPRTYFPLFIVTKDNGNWSIALEQNLLFQPLPPGAIIGPPPK